MNQPTLLSICAFLLSALSCSALAPKLVHDFSSKTISRRDALMLGPATAAIIASTSFSSPASAGNDSVTDLLARLKRIPTFCIVNPEGAAYMIVNRNEGIARGYAFTTFEGALAVLGDAQRTAESKGYGDVWKNATITTIPADIAVRLALQRKERQSQKDLSLQSLVDVIPSAADRQDALAIDNSFKDQGKVPLFYMEGLQIQNEDGQSMTPVYFTKNDLLLEWNKQFGVQVPPRIQLLDLVDTIQNVLRGRGDYLPNNIMFVPSPLALEEAKELRSRGLAPYKVNRMIV